MFVYALRLVENFIQLSSSPSRKLSVCFSIIFLLKQNKWLSSFQKADDNVELNNGF